MITIFDTAMGSENLGDLIIMDSVHRELRNIFGYDEMFVNASTHDRIGEQTYKLNKNSRYSILGGTNILTSRMRPFRQNQWNLKFADTFKIKDVILLGVGWTDYRKDSLLSKVSKFYYSKVLSKKMIHSVRDNYTKNRLISYGFPNVINTACATMWQLTPEHCAKIPTHKATNVISTITDYNQDKALDEKMLDTLIDNYNKVYIWVQGSKDLEYIETFSNFDKLIVVGPSLDLYDEIIEVNDIDYVGTRLHAGIRAMQKFKRSIIIGIDNRALEKQKDFNITVLNRNEIDRLDSLLNSSIVTELSIDFEAISKWKDQFKVESVE